MSHARSAVALAAVLLSIGAAACPTFPDDGLYRCEPACTDGEACVDGACVAVEICGDDQDNDNDGSWDCDDDDCYGTPACPVVGEACGNGIDDDGDGLIDCDDIYAAPPDGCAELPGCGLRDCPARSAIPDETPMPISLSSSTATGRATTVPPECGFGLESWWTWAWTPAETHSYKICATQEPDGPMAVSVSLATCEGVSCAPSSAAPHCAERELEGGVPVRIAVGTATDDTRVNLEIRAP